MARLPRIVIPGLPHLVTQRGNRGDRTFFTDADYAFYGELIATAALRFGTAIWAYCLMPNHVHMIVVPADTDGLRKTFAEAHRQYTARINARNGWVGHLWQGRYGSVAMDEACLINAARYVSLNPVRAGLVAGAADWSWSSVRAHLRGQDDRLVTVKPLLDRIPDFAGLLEQDIPPLALTALRRAESVGRPLGNDAFFDGLERQLGYAVRPRRPGRKPAPPLQP
jgi:putative transposase